MRFTVSNIFSFFGFFVEIVARGGKFGIKAFRNRPYIKT